MSELQALKISAAKSGNDFGFLDAAFGLQRGYAIGGQEQAAFFGFDDDVLIIRVEG